MNQPVLRTERLLMVPLDDEHLELEVALDSDAEVLRYIWGRARTRDEVLESHSERMELGCRIDGLGYWVAFRHTGEPDCVPGEFVGLMMLPPGHTQLRPVDPDAAELGYRIARRHWRQGYASEASRELLRHAFETVGVRKVVADTMAVNAGSRAVMEKIGMRYVRTYFVDFDDPLPGTEKGEVLYEITHEAWLAERPH
ncbi:GNAT family N-acetyltransferase [Flexivirga caeni]|uniref:N-acetyltransferase n=1 Tax=Flexivirga caeni TaxID=2294115 RepID=A0A3M9MIT9_9MICO|nr:GNAT family N-acetyltransferase [Flexivirga caeni]RNI25115.1 N-acetyltransferase [Flexivirga caeni]